MTSFPGHRVVQGEVDTFAPAYEQSFSKSSTCIGLAETRRLR